MITEKNARVIPNTIQKPRPLTLLLPWFVAVAALVVYLSTLNHWVSFNSLGTVARVSGWTWEPQLSAPLYWLITYPFQWLPQRWIPLGLNLMSTVFAALTLALLARSVMLLPHDRTHLQRLKEKSEFSILTLRQAWLPPVFAVAVCGLQLTFWEHATVGSGEMLDLLIFAYIIRCLLEFRIDERQSWLTRAAFCYGLGMTNNWALLGFLPLFITALIWLKKLSFFNLRFLGQIALCGFAGLTLYLLLPTVQSLSDISPVPFWIGLRNNLGNQKGILGQFYSNARQLITLFGLTSLVPVLLISIKWASYFGDTSRIGVTLATLMFHVVHAVFLVACTWVALDPPFSARNKGFGLPFLTFYYLGALSVGYFVGYFLLIFGSAVDRSRRIPPYERTINRLVTGAVWIFVSLALITLTIQNVPQIRAINGPMLRQYTAAVLKGIPSKKAILLGDDLRNSLLVRAALIFDGTGKDYLFLNTQSLKWPEYHRFLKKLQPQLWPVDPPKSRREQFDDASMFHLVTFLSQTNALYYLHPTFGYYLEQFNQEPHGLAYRLTLYPTNTLLPPPLSQNLIAENEAFWAEEEAPLARIISAAAPNQTRRYPVFLRRFFDEIRVGGQPAVDALIVAGYYSRALNYWAVEMQKLGQLAEAGNYFKKALTLNPDNVVAQVNLQCNENLQAGRKSSAQVPKSVEDAFGQYRSWDRVMGQNGPFDEPTFCFEQGRLFAASRLFRQAGNQFARVKQLAPSHLAAPLWLAQIYLLNNSPDEALRLVQEIHSHPETYSLHRTNQTELLYLTTSAHLAKGNVKEAEQAVHAVMEKYPNDEDFLLTATQVFLQNRQFSSGLTFIDQELKVSPDNVNMLVNKGFAHLQLKQYDLAIPPLTRALTLQTNNHLALLNRAIAHLGAEQLDLAQTDYEALQKAYPTAFQVYFGLQEIAYKRRDTNAAVRYCELYLTNSPAGNPEAAVVVARLKELRPGSP